MKIAPGGQGRPRGARHHLAPLPLAGFAGPDPAVVGRGAVAELVAVRDLDELRVRSVNVRAMMWMTSPSR